MKKKLIAAAALSAFLCTGITVPAEAAKSVPVTLPAFDVTLNGQIIENDNRQYPLLVYNNITYVPMTYHDCRFLGLTTKWNPSDGLSIMKYDMTSAYHKDSYPVKNKKRDIAQIASGTIKVNDKTIDNTCIGKPNIKPIIENFALSRVLFLFIFEEHPKIQKKIGKKRKQKAGRRFHHRTVRKICFNAPYGSSARNMGIRFCFSRRNDNLFCRNRNFASCIYPYLRSFLHKNQSSSSRVSS